MGLNFPDNPGIGTVFFTGEFFYRWDGTKWRSFYEGSSRDIKKIDNIAPLFDGNRTTFPINVNGSPGLPGQPEKYLLNVGGITQEPYSAYTTTDTHPAQVTFLVAPDSGLTFHGLSLQGTSPNRTDTVLDGAVTPSKISTGGPSWSGLGTVSAVTFSGRGDRLTGVSSQFNAAVGISSGGSFIGIATQINFIGAGYTFAFRSNSLGDATIDLTNSAVGDSNDITASLFL